MPGGLILLYHRVADLDSDPWSLAVSPQHFAEHLEVLRDRSRSVHLQLVPLRQVSQALRHVERSHRPVFVTFDDGYADNLYNAKPLLERYDIPATVFVAAGYVGKEREFWWDELDRLLLQPSTLPATLRLSIDGQPYKWDLGGATRYGEDEHRRYRGWSATGNEDPSPRHSLYRSLWQSLLPLTEEKQREVLDELSAWAGAEQRGRPSYRALSVEEVVDLEEGGLIEVGAHTVTHPFLPALPAALQRQDIRQSRIRLEDIVGYPVTSFAYPYGGYTAKAVALVREAGFVRACSTVADTVWRRSDRLRLPRVEVQDWDGEEFERRLAGWLGG